MIDRRLRPTLKVAALLLFLLGGRAGAAAQPAVNLADPAQVIHAYLRATYARDYAAAYRLISAKDQAVRTLDRYLRQRGAYSGFLLEAAKKVSEFSELKTLQRKETAQRIQSVVEFRAADLNKLAPALLHWDAFRLNSLPLTERQQMLDALEKNFHAGAVAMSQSVERVELLKEGNEWRVFLDWAAGVKIRLQLDLPKSADLSVRLSQSQFVVQPGELFEVVLTIANRAHHAVSARIGHLVEPGAVADYLDFVQCGFLLPITIPAGKVEEFSGTYLLRGGLPEGVRQLKLTYDFRLLK